MRVLVVGGGGREHALVWSLHRSSSVTEIHAAPGNPGIAELAQTHPAAADDIEAQVQLAETLRPHLVVVGPEAPLVAGLGDRLRDQGTAVFGPRASGAQLEGSKSFAKSLMLTAGIPTASSRTFSDPDEARRFVRGQGPVVIKADGLAAGKGVVVCSTPEEAERAVTAMMEEGAFGGSGSRVVIEERMYGEELSLLALCDGKTVVPMQPAQDFKRVGDGDTGPNTGGMGSYSPVPFADDDLVGSATEQILEPIADALAQETGPYVGVIYAGLMMTDGGPRVVEFNCRFGDPEAQTLLPRLTSDLGDALLAAAEGRLHEIQLTWDQRACVGVVVASEGYPGPARTSVPISGVEEAEHVTGLPVFHAGTTTRDGTLVTSGGRVLTVCAMGETIAEARARAYEGAAKIEFEGMHHRSDIAKSAAGEG